MLFRYTSFKLSRGMLHLSYFNIFYAFLTTANKTYRLRSLTPWTSAHNCQGRVSVILGLESRFLLSPWDHLHPMCLLKHGRASNKTSIHFEHPEPILAPPTRQPVLTASTQRLSRLYACDSFIQF